MGYVVAGTVLFILLLIAATAAEIYRETHHFRVTRYDVSSEKLAGINRELKILFLSDLHNCTYGNGNERLLQSIRDEKPDLILIGGDMLVGKAGESYEISQRFVEQLPKICPTVYTNGNHEQRMKEDTETYGDAYEVYKKSLETSGVHFLEDTKILVELGITGLYICGLELPSPSYKKFRKDEITASTIEKHFGFSASADAYTILLAHNPAYMDAYLEWGARSARLSSARRTYPRAGSRGNCYSAGLSFPKIFGRNDTGGQPDRDREQGAWHTHFEYPPL